MGDERPAPPPTPEAADLAELTKPVSRLRDPSTRYDRFGRKQPRPTDTLLFIRATPGLIGRMRLVPRSAIVEEHEKEGEEEVLLTCPCESKPVIPRDDLTKCPGCERWYWWMRPTHIYVAYANMQPPGIGNSPAELEG